MQSNSPVPNFNYSVANGGNSTSSFITILSLVDPTAYDSNYQIKTRWVNTVDKTEWILIGFNSSSSFQDPQGSTVSNPGKQSLALWLLIGDVDGINGTWTPTINGSTPGTTVYSLQSGSYVKSGSLVTLQFAIVTVSATGTGDLIISGNPTLPYPISGSASNVVGSVAIISSLTWPVGTTNVNLYAAPSLGTNNIRIIATASATAGNYVQMANVVMNIQGTISYQI